MKKLFFALFVSICFITLLSVCCAAADDFTYTLSADNASYVLTSYKGNKAEVRIPEKYNGLPVSKIASGAFAGNISVYKIIIPSSVKTVEDGAFSAMPSLYEFEASGGYTTVGGALYTADKKTLVRYPENRTGAFTVPAGASVGAHAFSGCRLTEVDASGAAGIGEYAFYASDIKSITLSASLASVGEHAFEKSAIEKAVVPGKTSLSAYAFASCEKLVYADITSASLDGEGVFYGDTSLLAVSFPQSQTVLPKLTFAGCTSLVTAPIGKNVRTVGEKAFYGCVSLKYASYGTASCASDAFGLCDGLTPDKKTFSPISEKSKKITLKTGESYKVPDTQEFDIFTASHIISARDGVITASFEGEASAYVVSRRGGDCAMINITVSDGAALTESDHPYGKGTFKYTYTVPGSPERIAVTFSSSDMLSPADAVKIQDKKGNLYGTFYGGALSGKTLFIDGDTVRITLVSITSGSYGFRVVSADDVSSLAAVKKITLPASITVKAGEEIKLAPAVSPSNAFPQELLYVSDDKSVAVVKGDGTVCGVKEGTVRITVYSPFYGVSAECTVTVTAQSGDAFDFEITNNRAYITNYKGAPGVCTIPKTLGGCPVCGIYASAFAYRGITELNIPRSVFYIAPSTLDGNPELTAINAPGDSTTFKTVDGVLYTKDGKTLSRVPCGIKGAFTVPDDVTSISDGAFSCCFGIDRVILGSSTENVSGKAFLNCTNLRSITSYSNKYTVSDGVLYTADKKTLVYFPAALNVSAFSVAAQTEKIGAEAFNSAVNLKRLILPASVAETDGTALKEAYYITEITVNSTNPVYTVSDGVLYENGDLKFVPKNRTGALTVKDDAARILPYALCNCAYITDVVFPSKLIGIGDRAFEGCSSLDTLYIPPSVKSIGDDAFRGDVNLYVYIPDGVQLSYLSDCTVLCGKGGQVCSFCEENGVEYEYMYRTDYGIYTAYTPVKADLRVSGENDQVLLSKYSAAAGNRVKAFDIYLLSDGVKLPLGEYALFRQSTSSKRYYYQNGQLSEIKADAVSVYRRYEEHIIEFTDSAFSPGLSVRTLPDKTRYTVYDAFDKKGLTLYYTNDYGMTSVIDDGYEISCDLRSQGEKTVSVRYNGVVTSFKVNVDGVSLSGTVKITGSAKYGGTVTADTSGVTPAGTELSYQWYSNKNKISGADKSTYKPSASDIGASLTVTVKAVSGVAGELTSAAVTVSKATAPAPPKPVIKTATETSVTLQTVDGCEYKLSDDKEFRSGAVFEGLKPGETYIFCQRYKETATALPSDVSSTSYTVPRTEKLESDKYFINTASGTASLIDPGTTVKTLKQNFKNGDKISVVKDGKTLSDGDTVGTGCEIRISSGDKIYDKCTAVITGDVNGDGKITITDYLKIKERIQNGTALSKDKEYASDVNGDGKVTITDYLRLKYCIQNGVKPEQNRY